jgi:hypothetical protein
MLEYPDVGERRRALAKLIDIEDRGWVQVAGFERVFAIADEDLPRENDEKTSAVHFLRFELTPAMIAALKQGAGLALGIDHPNYRYQIASVAPEIRQALAGDLCAPS